MAGTYQRRRPEETTLYRTLAHNWRAFLATMDGETDGAGLPGFVVAEVDAFLRCGILAHGFVRLACEACRETRLVAFSCKDVGFAASLEPPLTRFESYRPFAQNMTGAAAVTVRSKRRPEALIEEVRRTVAAVDPDWLVWEAMPARALMDRSLANFEMTGWLVAGCAALGVVLAALGVYGLFAGFVIDRTREIGVRLALGAGRVQVLWLVLRMGCGWRWWGRRWACWARRRACAC